MAVNYKRRKSNISNRNWSEHTEKQNAKYMSKQLKDFGYKIPEYMKKGQISEKQLETYSKRLLNNLDKLIDKEYKNSLTKSERRQYNKLNKIIIGRGGEKNNRKLINNALKIANTLKEYSKSMNRFSNTAELENVNRWVDKGYTNVETLLTNIHSSRLKPENGNLSSMLETIDNLTSDEHVVDYLDRIGASDSYRKTFMRDFNKLNVGQKIFFNTAVWTEFKIQYSKEEYYEATTVLAKRGYLEETLKRASNMVKEVM